MNVVTGSIGILAALAMTALAELPEVLTEAEMHSAIRTDAVSIPSPGECFAAINKVERPSWMSLIRTPAPATTTNRASLALNLGRRVADGFLAVEAQDTQRVKNIGKDITSLAKSLGIPQNILARSNSISDFAENNEWTVLREELDATQNEVKLAMRAQKDDALIVLVIIGGWLRSLEAASSVVHSNFTPESGRLLQQPAVLEFLIDQTMVMPAKILDEPLISQIQQGLIALKDQVELEPDGTIDEASVGKIFEITTTLGMAIAPEAVIDQVPQP